MQFGFTLQGTFPLGRTVSVTRLAEDSGFAYGWQFDGPTSRDPYVQLTLMAQATRTMRLGACVTNPLTRHPTVTAQLLATIGAMSEGRVDLGIGRGDSALRLLGLAPSTLAEMSQAVVTIRDLVEGRPVVVDGETLRLSWTPGHRLPTWVAGYGPRAIQTAAQIADGLIIQLADPALVRWFMAQLREAATACGREPGAVRVMVAAPAQIGPREVWRDRVRWFPGLVANHVTDLLRRVSREALPADLVTYVERRVDPSYIPQHTGDYSFIDDDIVDRFCVLGDTGAHKARLDELAAAGVEQFNLYLMNGEEEETLATYGTAVVPLLRGVQVTTRPTGAT
jgi:probable F420-dependent oxidoreductase